MESDGVNQIQYIEEMGLCANWGQNMLREICTEGHSGADTWSHCRSEGVYPSATTGRRDHC